MAGQIEVEHRGVEGGSDGNDRKVGRGQVMVNLGQRLELTVAFTLAASKTRCHPTPDGGSPQSDRRNQVRPDDDDAHHEKHTRHDVGNGQ